MLDTKRWVNRLLTLIAITAASGFSLAPTNTLLAQSPAAQAPGRGGRGQQQPPAGGGQQQAPAGGGQQQQAPAGGGQQAQNPSQPADTSSDVLKASNAREIATISCTDAPGETCFSSNTTKAIGTIGSNFNGTLLGNDGKDSSTLSVAIKGFLSESGLWDANVKWAVIHLARYDASSNNSVHDRWILAERKSKDSIELSDSLHIPGVKRIAVVFLHLNVPFQLDNSADAKPAAQQVRDAFSNVSYRAIVAKKLPINIQNLLSLLKLATNNFQGKVVPTAFNMAGSGVIEKVDVPSDVTVFGVEVKVDSTLIGQSQKYDNEGKYWWDASVGVPVNKLTLLDYSSDAGVYTPKTINKQSIYALVNIYPDLVDLKYGDKRWLMPRAVAGIGLTGRPGENFMIGGAWGIKQLQFFVGSAFANHNVAPAGTSAVSGTAITQRYSSHLTYGINVPVVDALKKLASSSGNSSNQSSAKSTSK